MDNCLAKMPITCYSPDIKELECGSVLSFNYTAIPTDIYPSLTNTHNIHGRAKADRSAAENNMVLGVKNIGKVTIKACIPILISIKNSSKELSRKLELVTKLRSKVCIQIMNIVLRESNRQLFSNSRLRWSQYN